MSALPAWAGDLVCEACCDACQRPLFITLPDILRAQPVRCACGRRYVPPAPAGLAEIAALLATLEYADAQGRASRAERRRLARVL